jgi:phosphatidate cytidylyltransferase
MRRISTPPSSRTRPGTGSSGSSRTTSNLALRVGTAIVGIPIVLAVDYAGGWVFAALVALVAAIAAFEFYLLCRAVGSRPALVLGVPAAGVIAGLPVVVPAPDRAWLGILVLLALTAGTTYLSPHLFTSGLDGWLATVGGAIYAGVLLGHLSLLRHLQDGAWWVFAALLITWAYDTGAYCAGSQLGRRPFMHHISPKKTVEGVMGGLVLAGIAGFVLVPTVGVAAPLALGVGLLLGVVAQVGDLVESMFKRRAGVKDSSGIIPGHGGMLDRIDALLFTGAVMYYAAALLGYVS